MGGRPVRGGRDGIRRTRWREDPIAGDDQRPNPSHPAPRDQWARDLGVDPSTVPAGQPSSQLLRARAAGAAMAAGRAPVPADRPGWRAVFAVAFAWAAVGGLAVVAFLLGQANVDEPPPRVYVVTAEAEPATTTSTP